MNPIDHNKKSSDNIVILNENLNNHETNQENNIPTNLAIKLFANRFNKEYILNTLKDTKNPHIFTYASRSKLQTNNSFLIEALKINYKVFELADSAFKDNTLFIGNALLAGVDIRIMEYADKEKIKDNPNNIHYLASKHIKILFYMNESLRKNTDLALKILHSNTLIDFYDRLTYFDQTILFNARFIAKATERKENFPIELIYLARLNDGFKNQEFLLNLAKASGGNFDFSLMEPELKEKVNFIKDMLSFDFKMEYDYLGDNLKNSKAFAIDILLENTKNIKALKFFTDDIKNDLDVLLTPIKHYPDRTEEILEFFESIDLNFVEIISKNKELTLKAIDEVPSFFLLLKAQAPMNRDLDIVLKFLSKSTSANDFYLILEDLHTHIPLIEKLKEVNPILFQDILPGVITNWTKEMELARRFKF